MATRKVIGKLLPNKQVDLNSSLEKWMFKQDGYKSRLDLIPSEVSPSTLTAIRNEAAKGNLGRLFELYMKMEATDTRYGGLVNSFKAAIGGLPLKKIVAEGTSAQEKSLAQDYMSIVEENLSYLDTHNLIKSFADAYIKGLRAFELKYELIKYPHNKRIALATDIQSIPLQLIRMEMQRDHDFYGDLKVITKDKPDGIHLKNIRNYKKRFIVLEDGEGKGYYDTMGVSRKALGWWLTKIYTQSYWVEFAENYGQPHRIARYPSGAGKEVKREVKKYLELLGRSPYAMFPTGMDVQLLQANHSGTNDTFQNIIRMANEEMAMAVVGQIETVGDNRFGSRAKAQVLNNIRYEILEDAALLVKKGFDQLIEAIILVNYGDDYNRRLLPTVKPLIINTEDNEAKVKTFKALTEIGVEVPKDHVYEQTGVPRPKEGEEVINAASFNTTGTQEGNREMGTGEKE